MDSGDVGLSAKLWNLRDEDEWNSIGVAKLKVGGKCKSCGDQDLFLERRGTRERCNREAPSHLPPI